MCKCGSGQVWKYVWKYNSVEIYGRASLEVLKSSMCVSAVRMCVAIGLVFNSFIF